MPLGELHRRRKGKNYALLGILIGIFFLLFAITVIRYGSL